MKKYLTLVLVLWYTVDRGAIVEGFSNRLPLTKKMVSDWIWSSGSKLNKHRKAPRKGSFLSLSYRNQEPVRRSFAIK